MRHPSDSYALFLAGLSVGSLCAIAFLPDGPLAAIIIAGGALIWFGVLIYGLVTLWRDL